MLKFKDTGILNRDIKSKLNNDIIGNKGDLVIIENSALNDGIAITNTRTRQFYKVNKSDITIDYSDITENIRMPLLYVKGWTDKQLIKYV